MKERPILMSAPMVRALLNGSKTQTRRVVKPKHGGVITATTPGATQAIESRAGRGPTVLLCPYGLQGERLWVRETWAPLTAGYAYRADPIWNAPPADRWHPSIHMPRAASRITLEITGVRVERLQDISEADAKAEGTPCYVCGRPMDGRSEDDCHCFHRSAQPSDYRSLWESINGPGSWDANPYVWVLEFKRVTP